MLQAQHLPHFLRQPIISIFDCVQFAGHVDHVVSLKRGVLVLTSELVLHCGLVSLVLRKRINEGWACCILGTFEVGQPILVASVLISKIFLELRFYERHASLCKVWIV